MPLTAADADAVAFTSAPVGRRGYAKQQVDALVRRVARTLADEDDLTAAEVHHVEFDRPLLGKRGYNERDVDAFLDRAEDELLRRRTGDGEYRVPDARASEQANTARRRTGATDARHGH